MQTEAGWTVPPTSVGRMRDGAPGTFGPKIFRMSRLRVLLVDDAARIRAVVGDLLELDGRFEVIGEAENGLQAVSEAERLRPDAVVLDVDMPVMDGLAAAPAIRAAVPGTRVVVFSTHPRRELERVALEAGASAYVEKGASVSSLVTALLAADAARSARTAVPTG